MPRRVPLLCPKVLSVMKQNNTFGDETTFTQGEHSRSKSPVSRGSRFRFALRLHTFGSYGWAICYAPGIIERLQRDGTLPIAAKVAGGLVVFLLAPLIAPVILLAAPVAAIFQNRPLMPIYFIGLGAYAAITIAAAFWWRRRETQREHH